jgi:hypothetical protein
LAVVSFTEQVAADVSNQIFSVIVLDQTEGKIQKLQIYENYEE